MKYTFQIHTCTLLDQMGRKVWTDPVISPKQGQLIADIYNHAYDGWEDEREGLEFDKKQLEKQVEELEDEKLELIAEHETSMDQKDDRIDHLQSLLDSQTN
jgi:hypothetical protein